MGNKPKLAINYTRPADVKASTMLEIAKKLTSLISVDASELKERDLKDYWVATNPDKVDSLLTAEEKKRIAKRISRRVKRMKCNWNIFLPTN